MRNFFDDVVAWFHRQKPITLFWLSVLLIFSTSSLCVSLIYLQARSEIFVSMKEEADGLARLAAFRVNGDLHATIRSPEQVDSPEYEKAVSSLVEYHRSLPHLRYVYTMILGEGVDYFILDTATREIIRELHPEAIPSMVMEAYEPEPDEDKAMNEALLRGESYVYDRLVTDSFGTFITAHAPFYRSSGELEGFVGVDMDVSLFHDRLYFLTRYSLLSLVVGLVLSLLLGRIAMKIRARSIYELESRKHAEAEEIKARLEAQELTRKKGELLAIVAHDMKNPLGAVAGWVDLLKLRRQIDSEAEYREFEQMTLENIRNATERMLQKVEEILRMEAAERVGVRIDSDPRDVTEAFMEAIRLNEPAAHRKDIEMHISTEKGILLPIDRNRIIEALDNIINNAVKYSPPSSHIHLVLKRLEEGGACIKVTDSGPGFTEEDREVMYQRFQTLSAKPTGNEEATGLGLAIAREIIEFHGGNITCNSISGQGSTFTITLPERPLLFQEELISSKGEKES